MWNFLLSGIITETEYSKTTFLFITIFHLINRLRNKTKGKLVEEDRWSSIYSVINVIAGLTRMEIYVPSSTVKFQTARVS